MDEDEKRYIAQHVSLGNVIGALAIYFAISIALSFYRAPRYPTSIPWVGHGKGWLAALRNVFGALTSSKQWMQDGYTRYSKHNRSFVLPASIGSAAETVIPRAQMSWMLEQPDDVLSTQAAHYDLLHGAYSFVDPVILRDPYHEHVVHKNFARNLNGVIPGLNDEVVRDVDALLGFSGSWKSLNVMGAFMDLVPRITNRTLVGSVLCREEGYIANMLGFTNDVIRGMFVFALFPRMMHPVVGRVAGLAAKYHWWRTSRYTLPVIRRRLEDIRRRDSGDEEYKGWVEPNDFVSWSIRTAMADGRADELDAKRISMRIMPINFASIHTTAMTGHAALLDIFSADESVVDGLREEAERVFREEGGKWTKQGLARMYRMDSAIRESQRYSSFALTFVHRKVLAKEGVTSPEGVHFAYGTITSCPWIGVSSDGDIHERPDEYDAFRYSREREAFEAKSSEERDQDIGLKLRQTGLVTTSDRHFAFGHGRHAW